MMCKISLAYTEKCNYNNAVLSFRLAISCDYDTSSKLETAVNNFIEKEAGNILSVNYETSVLNSQSYEYKCLVTCMVVYEEGIRAMTYDPYWDEHPDNRMQRRQMYLKERARLKAEGVEDADKAAWDIVMSHE